MEFEVVVEIPQGQRNKYEMDDKVLCVAVTDPRVAQLRDIEDTRQGRPGSPEAPRACGR